ncbi:MAG: hypothetical protein JWN60_628 [Acidobacteria bacterium]|jgi:hypothetical protein|nr:hypothetical protein [Acidobacteriota bacterium]
MNNFLITGLVAWLLPGVGHILEGRWKRGIILGAVIWTMFIIGVWSGGAYYPGFEYKDGALLYLLNMFARFGNGIGSFIGFWLALNPPPNVAAWATFEYGGRFLEIAGLLNYLAVLDAVDINQGRKR